MQGFFVKVKYKVKDNTHFVTTRNRMLEHEFKQFCEDFAKGDYLNITELYVERLDN